jgi:cytochrome c-type biogenesis protein CcmH
MNRREALATLFASAALANPANGDPRLEKLFQQFIAPCCWRENLLAHHSPAADELRAEIRVWVAEGKTDDQIKQTLLDRYQQRILATPDGAPGQVLSWTPILATAAGIAAVGLFLHRHTHPTPALPAGTPLPDLPDEE